MSYQYDVFLSYRRHREWPLWVQNTFLPVFAHWLGEEVTDLRIFVDYEIETGDSWPHRLGQALGQSKILVPLFSRQYFGSPWCQLELGLMMAREANCGYRTGDHPGGLVVPAHIHDGADLPALARAIQAAQLQPFTNIRVSKQSLTEERLSEEIRRWVPDVAAAIRSAPAHQDAWNQLAVEEFVKRFATEETKQTLPPSLG